MKEIRVAFFASLFKIVAVGVFVGVFWGKKLVRVARHGFRVASRDAQW